MRVALYIRVSTKLQEDKYSLNAQKTELIRYAESMKWEIVDVYQDVDSGTKLDKKGLESMLDAVEEGQIDIVLCIEQDRLSRLDTVKWEYLKGVLRDNQVKIAEPGIMTDLTNEDDEFVSDLKNLLAQRSRRDMLRKMARGKRQRTREGKVWGRQPEEYHYDPVNEVVSINEERAWIIPFIDEFFLKRKIGTTTIAKELRKRCKTAEGKEWTSNHVLEKLKRKAYHGVFERTFGNGETITKPNVYPKLRSEETYNQIQIELKNRHNRSPAAPHFLRGIYIRCGSCEMKIGVEKTLAYGDKGQRYDIFSLRHGNENTRDNCKYNPCINVKRIQRGFIQAVKDILTDPEKARQYIDSDFDEIELERIKNDIKRLEKQKQSTQEKTDRLLDLYLDGNWPKEKLDANRQTLDVQLSAIEDDLSERKRKRDLIQSNQINYETVVNFLSIAERFDQLLDEQEQQDLVQSLFPNATLDLDNELFILHANLPQKVTVDIKVQIETSEMVLEREVLENSRKRYDQAQKYLNKQPGTTLAALSRALKCQPSTLKKDQERFGPLKNIAPNRLRPELRVERVKVLKKELVQNPKASERLLEEITGINRKTIRKLIKEEGLKH